MFMVLGFHMVRMLAAVLVMLALFLILSVQVFAQTVLQVPFESAVIAWDAPIDPPPNGAGVTRWYAINCGGVDVRIDVPATSVPVKMVVSSPGSYSCTLWAVNNFGKSAPTLVPAFEAGYIPATPANLRIEVR